MFKRFTPVLTLVAVCWLVFAANHLLFQDRLNQYGIIPRRLSSLPGILWAPVLHVSLSHLAANTLPLLVLGGILCARSRTEFFAATAVGTFLGGGLTWLAARGGCHVGASGLIFCFFGYLASLAYFRRTFATLALSLICIFAYGGMLRGLFPTARAISWEGHACGLAAGIALAWLMAKLAPKPPQPILSARAPSIPGGPILSGTAGHETRRPQP